MVFIWVNYNDLTATEPWKSLVYSRETSQMALIQVSELLSFTQIYLPLVLWWFAHMMDHDEIWWNVLSWSSMMKSIMYLIAQFVGISMV